MQSTRPPILRLMVIDREIRSGRFPNAPRLAEALEVSTRTVQRDLEFLRDSLGAPLEWSPPQNGYTYGESTFFLPFQQVTEGELVAVLVADKALSEYRGTPFEGQLRGIFRKLTDSLPEEVAISPEELAHAYSFSWTAPVRTDGAIFRTLQEAIRETETLEVLYHTQSRDVTKWRRIDPYHLANVDGEWYLLAFCHINKEIRVFRPSRVREVRRTKETFRMPGGFDPAKFLKTKFHAMAGETPTEVKVRFDRTLAGYITEREWGPANRLQYITDGGVDLNLTTENADAVIRWVLNWGPGAEILSPPWVRRRVREMLKRLMERYDGKAKKPRPLRRRRRAPERVLKPPSQTVESA
jgi:predicted DNA-binding transcriptional regulator YafY